MENLFWNDNPRNNSSEPLCAEKAESFPFSQNEKKKPQIFVIFTSHYTRQSIKIKLTRIRSQNNLFIFLKKKYMFI